MSRIFSVRINLDDLLASADLCRTAEDKAQWLDGFRFGARGGSCKNVSLEHEGWARGFARGQEARDSALAFQAEQKRKSYMRQCFTKNTTSEPTSVDTSVDTSKPPSISNNRVIEESKEPVNEKPNTLSPSAPCGIPFDDFWDRYGKKVGRRMCEPYWRCMSRERQEAAIAGIAAYHEFKPDPQFRLDPIRYLRREAWADEALAEQPKSQDYDSGCTLAMKIPTPDEARQIMRECGMLKE